MIKYYILKIRNTEYIVRNRGKGLQCLNNSGKWNDIGICDIEEYLKEHRALYGYITYEEITREELKSRIMLRELKK